MDKGFDQIITGKFNAILNNHSENNIEVNKLLRKRLLKIIEDFTTSQNFKGNNLNLIKRFFLCFIYFLIKFTVFVHNAAYSVYKEIGNKYSLSKKKRTTFISSNISLVTKDIYPRFSLFCR
jgi:hypothetical protein